MKESTLVNSIKTRLRADGWKVIKIHGGPNQELGLPDLLCIKRGRHVWLEVKVVGKHPSKIQRFRLNELEGFGATVAIVRSVEEAIEALK